jgi:hypothetical protein
MELNSFCMSALSNDATKSENQLVINKNEVDIWSFIKNGITGILVVEL